MSTTKDIIEATQGNDKAVYHEFRNHARGTRVETRSTTLNIIRSEYHDYHVTEVVQSQCSLFEFAAAGRAELTFEAGEDREAFLSTRTWRPVGSGVEKKLHPGKLDDDFRFARFHYRWEGKNYVVYHVVYQDPFQPTSRIFYILYPREDNINSGHCVETDELVLACGKWSSLLHEEIWVFDNGCWEKSHTLYESIQGASWEDVILDPEMKKGLIEDVQGFFDNRDLYGMYAVPWKRGIILHGVPGNGKTVSIKALISSLYKRPDQVSSLYVKSFETKHNTEQYSIRQIFTQARRCAPCLLIFEDLDSLVDDNIRSYFLNEVDGLESNDGILMIGSTNHLDKLDPAIAKRPSRFDRKYHFKLPAETERSLYANYWRQKLIAKNEAMEFPEKLCGIVAQLTEGFSFAYLKELFVMSLLSLVRGFKGDDFEIVDADEAASASSASENEEGTKQKEKAEETKPEESTVCTCAARCSSCDKPLPPPPSTTANIAATTPNASAGAGSPDPAAFKPKSIPSVDVPDHLADNVLLKVIKHHIRVLHAEMDSTKTEEWPSGKKQVSGVDGRASLRMQRLMVRNAARAAI